MGELEEAKAKGAAAYNAAADYFDHPGSSFWHRFGRRTVERLGLHEGETVLDVCCGSGGLAVAAAEVVGPKGNVVAVDLAERLIQLGVVKAPAVGLGNIELKTGDLLALGYPDASFDVVICVSGIFFVSRHGRGHQGAVAHAASRRTARHHNMGARPLRARQWCLLGNRSRGTPRPYEGLQPPGANFNFCGASQDACRRRDS